MSLIHSPDLPAIQIAAPAKKQIGVARVDPDGTIVLRLRVVGAASAGDAEIRYLCGTADYGRVRAHLPSLAVGRSVPIYNDWN